MTTRLPRIAIVTGEASGDLLAANLLESLDALDFACETIAVGGPRLRQTSARIIADNEAFSVMGLAEVLKDLPRLLRLKKRITTEIRDYQPDLFIGVDAPDLNFPIARELKQAGIRTMHYVSPSVWAWRPSRIDRMANFLDHLLTLFPFEPELYTKAGLAATFCGHPTAEQLPLKVDKKSSRQRLGLNPEKPVLAVLPGSRSREIRTMAPLFGAAIRQSGSAFANWQLLTANTSPEKSAEAQRLLLSGGADCAIAEDSIALLQAADLALVASGTVALEAMLCKTPMVVSYKISPLTSLIIKSLRMMQLPYYSLPNVMHGGFLVPEKMQREATPEALSAALQQVRQQDQTALLARFTELHESLLPPQPNCAASVVKQMLETTC